MIEFDPILVHGWLSKSAKRFPDKIALVCQNKRMSYKQIDSQSSRLACALIHIGVKQGDRVAIFLGNRCETVVSLYAVLKAGAVFVVLESSMKSAKLGYILDNCGAAMLITDATKSIVVNGALENKKSNISILWTGAEKAIPENLVNNSYSWDDVFTKTVYDKSLLGAIDCIDIDLAALIYTSGSTGDPKGVMSTHHNMISAARSIIQYIDNDQDDIILDVLPLSFDYGLYQVIMAFMFGGTVILEQSMLYLHQILKTIACEKVTAFPVVPTIVAMMLQMKNLGDYDFRSLRYITNTGAALVVEHIEKLREFFPDVKIFSMFGLTECKRVGYLPPDEIDLRPDSVGKAMPNCQAFIVDANNKKLSAGSIGELVIRGSNVMQGYWKSGELTAKYYKEGDYPAERLLYSGDFFRTDKDGYLYFLGRKDGMIKCKGERISAKEVENIICSMEGVNQAAAIGVADEILGQAVKIFIVAEEGYQLNENSILRYCAKNMENFMMPKYISFVEELPRTSNGKIDKKKLKIQHSDETFKMGV